MMRRAERTPDEVHPLEKLGRLGPAGYRFGT
jgi:hypothetical protein